VTDPLQRSVGAAAAALLASTTTLVCCALPALLVTLGAGATLVGLLAVLPQLVWLSEHKAAVFTAAAAFIAFGGYSLWRARRLPCPVDPDALRDCLRLRRLGARVYGVSVLMFLVGGVFAFVLPTLTS
jgi:hypothetical protein